VSGRAKLGAADVRWGGGGGVAGARGMTLGEAATVETGAAEVTTSADRGAGVDGDGNAEGDAVETGAEGGTAENDAEGAAAGFRNGGGGGERSAPG
jgi:hypothetical protein